ncbi:MAG: pyruvate formate lyase family protein [Leptospirales bacterium]
MEGERVRSMGQFDRTLYPFYKADIDAGRLTQDQAKELILFFFIFCKNGYIIPALRFQICIVLRFTRYFIKRYLFYTGRFVDVIRTNFA